MFLLKFIKIDIVLHGFDFQILAFCQNKLTQY